jgi:hypothetical protein
LKLRWFQKNYGVRKKMQKTKSLIAMILLIILTLPMMIQVSQIQPVKAANLNVPVYLKISAEPNPVGLGQTEFISLFFTKPIPNVAGQYYTGLTFNLVMPDGTNKTYGPYTADTTGGVGGIQFVPTVVGNYTVQAFYPGQNITTGDHLIATQSVPDTFTVQQDSITSYVSPPLPTEYWSRPIYATNWNWAQLGGNWWGLGKPSFTDTGGYDAQGNNFNPYSMAPNSGHIMWVKPTAFGGQPGLPVSGDQESQYTSTSILYRQFEPIILNGIIYYKEYPNVPTTLTSASGTPGWNAVDLRTGQLVWHKDTNDTLDFGMVLQFHTIQEYGTQTWLVAQGPSTGSPAYSVWQLFDPMTGTFVANITNVASTTAAGLVETRDTNPQGTIYIHTINGSAATGYTLTMWNSTLCLVGPSGTATIRPSGNINYTRGYQWSVPIPLVMSDNTTINPVLSIAGRTNDVVLLRSYAPAVSTFAVEFGEGSCIEAAMNATNGALLWGPVNRTLTRFDEVAVIAIGDNYYVEHDKDTNIATTFNLKTGQQIGSPIQLPGNALSTLERGGAIAYNKCYIWDFGGYVNAIDCTTGTLNWTYVPRTADYDTPYGIYPIWHFGSHSIADGKLFLSEGRMYDPPLFPNAHKLAINCTDGSLVWSELNYDGREPSAIADGYLVAWNSYDCQIYTFGKGPTSTTTSVGTSSVPFGGSVVISGSVLDQSAGTKDNDRLARFPNGVPAVSDASQSNWMEYVYQQQPKPTNTTGVTVTLSVMDANGNTRSIGTATSDASGFYSYAWTPDIDGKYTVYASFGGSESYWPSQAETAFTVEPTHPTVAPTATPTESAADMYFVPAIAGIFVLIIIVLAMLVLMMMRKRP